MVDHKQTPMLSLFVMISDYSQAHNVSGYLQKAQIPFIHQLRAEGTASSELLDILGLANTSKTITLAILPQLLARVLLSRVFDKYSLEGAGNGISFLIPLSGIASPLLRQIGIERLNQLEMKLKGVEKIMSEGITHHFIVAIVNQGYSETVMKTAKKAGVKGGTIVHAHHVSNEAISKFWGISLQDEKDVVGIVTTVDQKLNVMKAISETSGPQSEAHGMVFSLPIDMVAGIE